MKIEGATTDGVWYYANNSYAAFEWRTHNTADNNDTYQFVLEYNTGTPGTFLYTYYVLGYLKVSSTVGIQGNVSSKYLNCSGK